MPSTTRSDASSEPTPKPRGLKAALSTLAGWWGDESVATKAAALAFYTAFSLAPTILVLLLLVGAVVDTQRLEGELVEEAQRLLGDEGATLIEGMLRQAQRPAAGWAALFGIGAALFGATTAFAALKDSLDDILQERPIPDTSIWDTIRGRALSFGIVATLGFLLLVSLIANATLAATSDLLTRWFAAEAVWISRTISAAVAFLGTFALFLVIYRILPARRLSMHALVIGAVASTLLFSIGRIAIGLYLGGTDAVAAFGAAGSLAVVLIWVYYSALAFFAGALIARYVAEK